jgi:hypothetical protein
MPFESTSRRINREVTQRRTKKKIEFDGYFSSQQERRRRHSAISDKGPETFETGLN